jgi:glucosylceramidase
VGWIDWNLLLDDTGGPNHAGNLCSAPILADPKTGSLDYQSSYHYLGHFSRFIRPGAKRILCAATREALECCGFVNTDGSIAVVVCNRSDTAITFDLHWCGENYATELAAHAIATYVQAA